MPTEEEKVSERSKKVTKSGKRIPVIDHTLPVGDIAGTGGKTIPQKDRPTLRQRRLAKVENPGADDHEKGVIRGEGENLEWKDESGEMIEWGNRPFITPS